MKSRHINVDEAIKVINKCKNPIIGNIDVSDILDYNDGIQRAINELQAMPSADVVEVKHGKWIECCPLNEFNVMLDENIYFICSECKANIRRKYNFCPNCGTDMREEG